MKPIRNSAKAIIIQDNKILLTKNKDHNGFFYLLPGGGQEKFESISDALIRECKEEISAEINIGDIKFIRDYIGKNHEFAELDSEIHQIEYMFLCTLKPNSYAKNGPTPDSMQVGIEWIDLNKLNEYRIYPSVLKDLIKEDGSMSEKVYLGDVN